MHQCYTVPNTQWFTWWGKNGTHLSFQVREESKKQWKISRKAQYCSYKVHERGNYSSNKNWCGKRGTNGVLWRPSEAAEQSCLTLSEERSTYCTTVTRSQPWHLYSIWSKIYIFRHIRTPHVNEITLRNKFVSIWKVSATWWHSM